VLVIDACYWRVLPSLTTLLQEMKRGSFCGYAKLFFESKKSFPFPQGLRDLCKQCGLSDGQKHLLH